MPQIYGKTAETLPTAVVDGSQVQPRLSEYGDMMSIQLMDNHSSLANEGSYFKAINPTISTAIAGAATTAFSATAGLFTIYNTSAAGGKRIFIDYIRLMVVGAPTTSTSAQVAVTLDSSNRYSSGGSAITPTNTNMASSRATVATMFFGAVVLTAATGAVRTVARFNPKQAILVAGDVISMDFGEHSSGSAALTGAAAQVLPASLGPVIIGGGHSLNFHIWYPAATAAPTFEFEIGMWER